MDAGPFSLDYHTPPSCVVLDGYSYLINCSEGGGQTGSDKLYFHFLEWTDSLLCEGDNPVSVTYSAPSLSPCAAAESVQNGVVSKVYMTVLCTGGGGGGSSQLSSSSSSSSTSFPSWRSSSSSSLASTATAAPPSDGGFSLSTLSIALIVVSALLVMATLAICWLMVKRRKLRLPEPSSVDQRTGALQQPLMFPH